MNPKQQRRGCFLKPAVVLTACATKREDFSTGAGDGRSYGSPLSTATDRLLGSGKWSMGPTGVLLAIEGPWVLGALMNNQWSVGGWGDQNVNALLVQPFINYNLPAGCYLTTSPIITANWKADDGGERWTVPLGGGFGKLFRVGVLPVNSQLTAYGNVEKPSFASDWTLRFQVQFLFPK
jgi:hypothetical protein